MIYRDVQTLKLASGWVTDFILSNGITKIPDWWAFTVETCGILSWVVLFVFAIAMFVGYSRQMSSFYFLYEQMTGKKLSNPYKPAFLFFLLWCGLYVFSMTVTVAGVYFLKYGYIYAALAAIGGMIGLALIIFIAFSVAKEPKQKQADFQFHSHPPPQSQYAPAYTAVGQQSQQQYVPHHQSNAASTETLQIESQKSNVPAQQQDHIFEEALSILGLERGFTKAQLKKRYHDLAKKFHSDKGGTNGLYLKIKACYEYLVPFAK